MHALRVNSGLIAVIGGGLGGYNHRLGLFNGALQRLTEIAVAALSEMLGVTQKCKVMHGYHERLASGGNSPGGGVNQVRGRQNSFS